jgi:hypothetical protein
MTREGKTHPAESEVAICLNSLAELTRFVYAKEPFWKVKEMVMFPAVGEDEIESLSIACPVPLPPSYRDFLRISDGCLNFWPQFALLGTKGEPRKTVEDEVEDARNTQQQYAAGPDGKLTPQSIAVFEAPAERAQQFFLPNHLVFGTDRGGEFFMFNDSVKPSSGEYEVIHYTYSGGAYYRYPNFHAFLEATIAQLQARIKEKGYGK